jgi:sterol desaturase/sphingolipid hydroxylase (fatty acid hydroxylase superfamily)
LKAKYLREYFFFPDILIMNLLFIISFSFMVPHMASIGTWIAFALGMVGYTVTEYTTHRFLFHIKAPKNAFLLSLVKRLHYDHHTEPNNLHLLFLPLWYSLPNIIVVAGLVFLVTSNLVITNAVIAGVILFLLYYEWVHYIAHRPIQPVSTWGRWIKKVHLWHHFKNENYWYGVTNPVFDVLLGTFKDQKDVEQSKTARNLEERGKQKLNL